MTNLEKLQRMNAEEFLEFIKHVDTFGCCDCCVYGHEDCGDNKCNDSITKWLESEAE